MKKENVNVINRDTVFESVWSALRFYDSMGRNEIDDYEFFTLLGAMYQTKENDFDTQDEWDEFCNCCDSLLCYFEDEGRISLETKGNIPCKFDTIVIKSNEHNNG